MKRNLRFSLRVDLLLFGLCLLCSNKSAWGQISITSMGLELSQDFDSLANAGTSSKLPTGWAFLETGFVANGNYMSNDGSDIAGDTYSYGTGFNSDRALGGLRTDLLVPSMGVAYINQTGAVINSFAITYTGEEWRLGTSGRTDQLDFQYSLNATSLSTGTWVDFNTLDFITPSTSLVGPKNGNLPANRTNITATISGLAVADGATFWFRWTDFNAAGSDDGLGIDDYRFRPNCIPATANAGPDQNTCPNGLVQIAGTLGGSATSGTWDDGGAGGTFLPNVHTLAAYYTPPTPNLKDSIPLIFTATGACLPISDTMVVHYGVLPPVILSVVSPDSAACGDLVTFQIVGTSGFTDISSQQYSINWDPTKLEYFSNTVTAIGGGTPGIGDFDVANGQLTYVWFDSGGSMGEDLADGTVLLSITMKILADLGSAEVLISTTPITIEITNSQFCVLIVERHDAVLSIVPIEVHCPADTAVSIDAAPFTLSGGSPASGAYTGDGVSAGEFSPLVAGIGVHPINYAYTNASNCSNDCSFNITVNALPTVICPGDLAVCTNTGAFSLSGASPIGGIYSGTGVNAAGVFDPVVAGVGVHDITYTYATGNSCAYSIRVHPDLKTNISGVTNESCTGGSNGAIDLSVSGGAPSYSYDWSNNGPQDPDTDPEDLSGLANGTYTVTVTDGNTCTNTASAIITTLDCPKISGTLIWEGDRLSLMTGVDSAKVTLSGDDHDIDITGILGTYLLNAVMGSNFSVKPVKNEPIPLALQGLNAADVSRILQHLAGFFALTDPYRIIAADPNGSDSLSSEDGLLVQQALLGESAAQAYFTQSSWRFVPKAHTFPVPGSPWGFPEKIDYVGISGLVPNQDFIGIKMGDVQHPADTLSNPGGLAPDLVWLVQDKILQQDSTFTVVFKAKNFEDLLALQFGIKFVANILQFLDLETIVGSPMQAENFGLNNTSAGELRALLALAQAQSLPDGTPGFLIKFKVLQGGGKLSEAMQLNDAVLLAEAYNSYFLPGSLDLVYENIVSGTSEPRAANFSLLQNRPNPFKDMTVIGFIIPDDCEAQIRIFDLNGKLVMEQKGWFAGGYNEQKFRLGDYVGDGVLYYELLTPYGILSKKMTLLKD